MRSSTPPTVVRVGGLALAGIVLVGSAMIYLSGGNTSQTGIKLASAKRGTVVSGVSAAGNTMDANIRDLAFGASGTVEKIYVKVGQKVGKGHVLARIDDTIAREDYTAATASLAAAEETLTKLEEAQNTTPSGSGNSGQGAPTGGASGGPSAQPSGQPSAQSTCPPTASGSPRPSGSAGPSASPTVSSPSDGASPPVGFTLQPSVAALAAAEVADDVAGAGAGNQSPAAASSSAPEPTAALSPTATPSPTPSAT
ncbi:MAG: Membrane-fusion protein-like protein, partial [Sphaerisporangium sp.]|nr:Membrane-fusion protein-like protein [Sphaerisporangium sp.]